MTVTLLDVLADRPFAEVGQPRLVVDAPEHGLVVVAGDLGWSQWFGYGGASRRHARVGVYDRADLACRQVARPRWPVNDIAVHPSGTLVAVGTGSYDGGYSFEGELLVLDLRTGATTSVLRAHRQVCSVRWLDSARLAFVLAPTDDDGTGDWDDLTSEAFEVEAPWDELRERELDLSGVAGRPVVFAYPKADLDAARADLRAAAARADRSWSLRRAVWSVLGGGDGSILAAGEHVAAERWSDSGGVHPLWSIPTEGVGCHLAPLGHGTVLSTVERRPGADLAARRSEHEVVDTATGSTVRTVTPGYLAVAVVSADGDGLLRRASRNRDALGSVVLDVDGDTVGHVRVPGYDLFNHWFDVKRAPDLLVLTGSAQEPHLDKWITVVERGTGEPWPRRLFPLDWEAGASRHLQGGPGVFVDDDHGPALVHCGLVHAPTGARGSFVVRRGYPDGAMHWLADLPGPATGADEVAGVVAVTTVDGWLVLLDSRTGAELGSVELQVRGVPVVPLSVSAHGDDLIAVGLLDGRILRMRREGLGAH